VPAVEVPAMRIDATAGMSWVLRTDGGRSDGGICHSGSPLLVCNMSADGIVVAGVRAAISTVHDSDDGVVSESAVAREANAEGCGRSCTRADDAISTRAAMGGSIPPTGRRAVVIFGGAEFAGRSSGLDDEGDHDAGARRLD